MLDFLPETIKNIVLKAGIYNVYEIRIRKNCKLSLNVKGIFSDYKYVATEKDISQIINSVSQYSLYSFSENVKKGYITAKNGERIGFGGQFVYDKNEIVTIKNISSLCVRIPHAVLNSGEKILELFDNGIKNVLILSPPGMGKTTILRNISCIISDKFNKNVVMIDEKMELSSYFSNKEYGSHTDVLSNVKKSEGIYFAIKNMRPDIIITDEISDFDDYLAIYDAVFCGVKVICSIHSETFADFVKKRIGKTYLKNGVFDYYVEIGESVGNVKNIYSHKGEKID